MPKNSPAVLFNDLFGKEENKSMALLYLSSLMSVTETPEELAVKRRQAYLLRDYLTQNALPDGAYYLKTLAALDEILARDLQAMKHREGCR